MFDKLIRHSKLMNAMSRETGLDPGRDIEAGRLGVNAYRNAVFTCTSCRHVAECENHLSVPDTASRQVPDFCLNKNLLMRLRSVPDRALKI